MRQLRPTTRAHAALIDAAENAPASRAHLKAWHRDKYRLHPELFTPPRRSFREGRWWQSKAAIGYRYGMHHYPGSKYEGWFAQVLQDFGKRSDLTALLKEHLARKRPLSPLADTGETFYLAHRLRKGVNRHAVSVRA